MIKSILQSLRDEPGTKAKLNILESNKDNDLLKKVCYLAESKRIKFYIKKIPNYVSSQSITLEQAVGSLNKLYNRELTGHSAISHLEWLLSNLSQDDAHVLECIISKDLKCNVGTSMMNSVWKNLIEETPYMGAQPYKEQLAREITKSGPAISQIKMDGQYCNAIVYDGNVDAESRAGEAYYLGDAPFMKELKQFDDIVLNGELVMDGYSRFESNGIISSLINIGKKIRNGDPFEDHIKKLKKNKNIGYHEALGLIKLVVWDCITINEYSNARSDRPYDERLKSLQRITDGTSMIKMVESMIVKNYREAMDHFKKALIRGEEGTILKSLSGTWVDDKPKWQVKMKLVITVEMKITGFNLGTGKNSNVYSSINVESECGKVVASPQGLKEDVMKYITDSGSSLLGKIIEVKCSGVTPENDDGKRSLLFPVFVSFRDDKIKADDLESILRIENMTKDLAS